MALIDEVTSRYTAQRLLNLTNPDTPAATTRNDTRLASACTDAAADFTIFAGVAYDNTKASHVVVACRGVIAYLLNYMDSGAQNTAMQDFHYRLKDLAKVTGRDRVMPDTKSPCAPTVEGNGAQIRPPFDSSAFAGIQLDQPRGGGDSGSSVDDDERI